MKKKITPLSSMLNNLYEEDCIECMQRIPPESIDMILCDLPYGMTQNNWDKELWDRFLL